MLPLCLCEVIWPHSAASQVPVGTGHKLTRGHVLTGDHVAAPEHKCKTCPFRDQHFWGKNVAAVYKYVQLEWLLHCFI